MTATQQAVTTKIRVAETRIKVCISYSRADKAFASELVLGLAACGFAPYIDRQDIAPGEDWEKRLAGLITEADSIVYIVSPDSLASENCALELRQAVALRSGWYLLIAGGAPLLTMALMFLVGSDDRRALALLTFAGLAGLAFSFWAHREISDDVAALIAAGRPADAAPSENSRSR
jgi:hypothetical protein